MAFVKVIKNKAPAQIIPLRGAQTLFGRHKNCQVVLDDASISRQHAQILESHGRYYLEDLRSRNGTLLNGSALEGRRELHDHDRFEICDFLFLFCFQQPSLDDALPDAFFGDHQSVSETSLDKSHQTELERKPLGIGDEPADSLDEHSSIISTLNASSGHGLRLNVHTEAKLQAIIQINHALGRAIGMDEVLDKILNGLFNIFPQADTGFVLLNDPESDRLVIRAMKERQEQQPSTSRISMTIIKQALDTRDAVLSADAQIDDRFHMSESISDLQIRSMLCIPLIGKDGDILGVMQLDTKQTNKQFTRGDLELFDSVASQASLAIENAVMQERLQLQRDMDRDLELATQIQLGFLPNERPRVAAYRFFDFYDAALKVGGDYFDYVHLPGNRLAIIIGDVAGKGVPAALLMARLYSAARFQLVTGKSVAAALQGLNGEIASSGLGHRFITCVVAILDLNNHTLTVANAGHLPPIMRYADRSVEAMSLKLSGVPLGIAPDTEYTESVLEMETGTTCVLYTDGITEAMNNENDIYGRHRLCEFIGNGADHVSDLIKDIVTDVEEFCAGRAQRDDMCLVAFQRMEQTEL